MYHGTMKKALNFIAFMFTFIVSLSLFVFPIVFWTLGPWTMWAAIPAFLFLVLTVHLSDGVVYDPR